LIAYYSLVFDEILFLRAPDLCIEMWYVENFNSRQQIIESNSEGLNKKLLLLLLILYNCFLSSTPWLPAGLLVQHCSINDYNTSWLSFTSIFKTSSPLVLWSIKFNLSIRPSVLFDLAAYGLNIKTLAFVITSFHLKSSKKLIVKPTDYNYLSTKQYI